MPGWFLQVISTANKATDSLVNAAQAVTPPKEMHLWDILKSGGPLMIPLGLMLVAVIYFFFERNIAIRKAGKIDQNFMMIIRDHIVNGNISAARGITRNTNHPVARIIDKGIQRIGKPIDAIERSMENVAQLEMYNLERNLSVLSVIARAAPIFGFIGTLAGLMQLFFDINTTGEFVLNTIAGGLYVKLVTSISGLLIGLLAFLAHSYLHTQIDKTANKMEVAAADFLDILQEPTR
ncbi:MotA/TolQ/ExbB proton channel family protein [Pollutibacter soli]|uniref:MotA/TolQ/ExbB proton channel family protein n=1 Tax=Pollutibacter soli TaxID=3034157 RepID=UPI0030140938